MREMEKRRKRRDEREKSNLKDDERDGENGWFGSLRKKKRETRGKRTRVKAEEEGDERACSW